MALTELEARNAKPRETAYKLADSEGLYLLVHPRGAKYWRLKYRYAGKEKVLALGIYPNIRLAEARQRRVNAKAILASGQDPSFVRKSEKRTKRLRAGNTFEAIAREWLETKGGAWSLPHSSATLNRLEKELFPDLGRRPIAEIEAPEILDVIRKIEARDALEIASKTLMVVGQVFRYAIVTGRAKSDPTRDLRGALKTRETSHYARLSDADLPEFLRKLGTYDGNTVTKLALKLLALTFVRTGELRGARWSGFDFEKAEWRIPAERMKTRAQHLVPLSQQAMAVLEQLKPITGEREHSFRTSTSHAA